MYTIRKKFKIEASHVLDSAYSKDCLNVHGHSYVIEVIISGDCLNEHGMLMDFGEIKYAIKPIIDAWDHALIFSSRNGMCKNLVREGGLKHYIMLNNPTAENMCECLYDLISVALDEQFTKLVVRIHETETGYAEYTEGEI
jgi:6-pyruvoyltetrahydropterin/6-carboxytetrahydropterin synthase